MNNRPPVSTAQLENTLRRLADVGTRIDEASPRFARQVWHFEHDGRPYRLHFYPRARSLLTRLWRGNPALREFQLLQALQKADVRSPRPSTVLIGYRLDGVLGDALILDSIGTARRLDLLLAEHEMAASVVPRRRGLLMQLIRALHALGRAGYSDPMLKLRKFVVDQDGKLSYFDVADLRHRGMRTADLMRLAHDARRYMTRTDALRVWEELGDAPLPCHNTASSRLWKQFDRNIGRDPAYFGRIRIGGWIGTFTRCAPHAMRWADQSVATVNADDWIAAWPALIGAVESGGLDVLKHDGSGQVLRGEVRLAGRTVEVVVKRPGRTRWFQAVIDMLRGSRAARTWHKTWQMLGRDVPCELPLLLIERRVLGYPIESVLVFQRVAGETLAAIDLGALAPEPRRTMFQRAGNVLRMIDDFGGFTHADAKSTNWIVFADPARGPTPILVDLYGIRRYSWSMLGLNRLLRAMKQHPQYTPDDSYHLCKGYAPEAQPTADKL